MRLNSLRELFSFKGLLVSVILVLFNFAIGFLGGFLLEMYYDLGGKDVLFFGLPIKSGMGIVFASGSWAYMLWLLIGKSIKAKKGSGPQ